MAAVSSTDDEDLTIPPELATAKTVTIELDNKSVNVALNRDMFNMVVSPRNDIYNRALIKFYKTKKDAVIPCFEHETLQRSIFALTRCLLALIAVQSPVFTTDIMVCNEAEPIRFDLDQYTYVSRRRKFRCIHVSPKPIHNTQYAVLYLAEFENGKHGVISRRVPDVIKIDLPSLSETSKDAVLTVANAQQNDIAFSVNGRTIQHQSLRGLLGVGWTNCKQKIGWVDDTIVNAYFDSHIQRRSDRNPSLPRVKCISPSFMRRCDDCARLNLLLPYRILKDIAPYSADSSMNDVDLVLFPITTGIERESHRLLIVANMREKELQIYDSKNGVHDSLNYCAYIQALFELDSSGANDWFDVDEWRAVMMHTPQQIYNIDCGVFMCKIADAISQDQHIQINRRNAHDMRLIMAAELYNERDIEE